MSLLLDRLSSAGSLALLALSAVLAGVSPSFAAPSPSVPPADVRAFITQRDLCDHFRGEEAYNAKRAGQLAQEMKRYCTGTDQALAKLRAKYARDAAVLRALKDYDDQVEGPRE